MARIFYDEPRTRGDSLATDGAALTALLREVTVTEPVHLHTLHYPELWAGRCHYEEVLGEPSEELRTWVIAGLLIGDHHVRRHLAWTNGLGRRPLSEWWHLDLVRPRQTYGVVLRHNDVVVPAGELKIFGWARRGDDWVRGVR